MKKLILLLVLVTLFTQGERYFVIAGRIDGNLRTDICTSPKSYSDVDAHIRELGRGTTPKAGKKEL